MFPEVATLPKFSPRFPWLGGDLQTLANRLLPAPPLGAWPERTIRLPLRDGSGDILLAALNLPREAVDRPLLILIHGLTGSQSSRYILATAAHFLGLGYPVLRLNLRGAGPSRGSCAGQYYAGRSEDFRGVLELLDPAMIRSGIVAVGYSLGGAMLLKYLGEEGTAAPLLAAATVSAPIDLSATCAHMLRPRNRFYHAYILAAMKREATGEGARLTPAERDAIAASRTIWDYDQEFIAPRHGFGGAEDYYEKCRPIRFMASIRVPTITISAGDDPWIPIASYRAFDWRLNDMLVPVLPASGGHVGFFGRDRAAAWSDRALERFFAAVGGDQRALASSLAASTAP